MTDPTELTLAQAEALAPLRRSLLEAALTQASARVALAEEEAHRVEAEADVRATAIVEDARRRGADDGAHRVRAERAAARREAGAVVQRARRAAYERLRTGAVEAVGDVVGRGDARDGLERLIRAELGEGTRLTDAPDGGVVGETADGRRVDASAARLVDLVMDRADPEGWWTP